MCIIDGEAYTQSGAIMRYAGKKSGLYPADDFEALKVDGVMLAYYHLRLSKTLSFDTDLQKIHRFEVL